MTYRRKVWNVCGSLYEELYKRQPSTQQSNGGRFHPLRTSCTCLERDVLTLCISRVALHVITNKITIKSSGYVQINKGNIVLTDFRHIYSCVAEERAPKCK